MKDTSVSSLDDETLGAVLEYLQTVAISLPQAVVQEVDLAPIAPATAPEVLAAEIAQFDAEQLLYSFKHYQVFYGTQAQMPVVLGEITRLRELTFRQMQEGSGQAVDTDEYDASYLHLFVWDIQAQAIVGGYRLGRTDDLLTSGNRAVYLAEMFDFGASFYEGAPKLEIGRSFVVPEYQRSHHSLSLLWCGIGQYIVRHPKYRMVYGVVSMSRLYDPTTIAAIRDALVEPDEDVRAKAPYEPQLGQPWRDFVGDLSRPLGMKLVSQIVRGLESGERDVPILIKHYHKLGARFVSAAVDSSFNNTPGLLLCLDVPNIPQKYLKQYLREGAQAYLDYSS